MSISHLLLCANLLRPFDSRGASFLPCLILLRFFALFRFGGSVSQPVAARLSYLRLSCGVPFVPFVPFAPLISLPSLQTA